MGTYTELSLFSGYGGFSLGLRLAGIPARTVCYVEWDRYCQRVLQARIADGHLDDAPIWDDIKSFDGRPWCGAVDILSAGFPCQPHSNAGLRRGADDDRNLWPDTLLAWNGGYSQCWLPVSTSLKCGAAEGRQRAFR